MMRDSQLLIKSLRLKINTLKKENKYQQLIIDSAYESVSEFTEYITNCNKCSVFMRYYRDSSPYENGWCCMCNDNDGKNHICGNCFALEECKTHSDENYYICKQCCENSMCYNCEVTTHNKIYIKCRDYNDIYKDGEYYDIQTYCDECSVFPYVILDLVNKYIGEEGVVNSVR